MARRLLAALAVASAVARGAAPSAVGAGARACSPERGLVEDCAASPIVQTADGPVQGFSHRSAQTTGVEVSSFWGIPFAQPPVGELRLRAPRPLNRTWSTPLAATKKSKACLQWEPGKFQSEDCLYLNVYTPTRSISADAGLPVMVWVHGGAYTQGDAYQSVLGTSVYDGSNIAGRHQLVVVTLQYRLNGLGFWASDQLREEDPAFSTGNMALRDQRAALQWVQRNARAFGGDPSRVTLFGESAGGFSVMWHLVSRPSWPLFQAAIMESGTDHLSWFFQPYEGHSKEFYAQWAEKIGCPASEQQLVCLRGKDALLLTRPPAGITVAPPTYDPRGIGQSMAVGPTIDGAEEGLASVPLDLVREGLFNRVPLLLGSCKDGGTIFEPILTGIVPGMDHMRIQSMDELLTALNWSFDADDVPKILSAYPQYEFVSGTRVDFSRMFTRIIRDCSFQCPVRSLASEWSKHGVPVWLYVFSFPLGIIDNVTGIGDLHGSDVLFVWRHFLWVPEALNLGGGAVRMANIVSCRWSTFAYTRMPDGPNRSSLPSHCTPVDSEFVAWPRYDQSARQYYSLQMPPQVGMLRSANAWPDDEFASDRRCDAWDAVRLPWKAHGPLGGAAASALHV